MHKNINISASLMCVCYDPKKIILDFYKKKHKFCEGNSFTILMIFLLPQTHTHTNEMTIKFKKNPKNSNAS